MWAQAPVDYGTLVLSGLERAPKIKTPVTVRTEAGLLSELRQLAREENRALTNLSETVLRQRLAVVVPLCSASEAKAVPARAAKRKKDKPTNAA